MKTDRISGIVIFAIRIAVFITSLTYPVGTLQKPGGGFSPLISSGLLMLLSAFPWNRRPDLLYLSGRVENPDAETDDTILLTGSPNPPILKGKKGAPEI